jgi:hypothetical protein
MGNCSDPSCYGPSPAHCEHVLAQTTKARPDWRHQTTSALPFSGGAPPADKAREIWTRQHGGHSAELTSRLRLQNTTIISFTFPS